MIKVGKKKIGDGTRCFITFEIGATHNGFESAKKLIYEAAKSGADAVKFQTFNADKLISNKNQLFTYKILVNKKKELVKNKTESLYKILKKRNFTKTQWKSLKKFCDKFSICFFSTVGFEEDVDFLKSIGCHSLKIASADINHLPLIKYAAKTKLPIQIDTGMATLEEISAAIKVIKNEGNNKIIIHHCPTDYPARLDKINLNIIKTLKEKFPYPIAYSDHTPGVHMDIAALMLGVNLIEKTVTENRMTPKVEHMMSIETKEMKNFITSIRSIEKGMGSYSKILSKKEKKNRNKTRRSLFMNEFSKKGQKLSNCKILFRRPGNGIQADEYEKIKNLKLKKDLNKGHQLQKRDLK